MMRNNLVISLFLVQLFIVHQLAFSSFDYERVRKFYEEKKKLSLSVETIDIYNQNLNKSLQDVTRFSIDLICFFGQLNNRNVCYVGLTPLETLLVFESLQCLQMSPDEYEHWVDRLLQLGAVKTDYSKRRAALFAVCAGSYKVLKKIASNNDVTLANDCLRFMFSPYEVLHHTQDTEDIIADLVEQGANPCVIDDSYRYQPTYLFSDNHTPETLMLMLDMGIDTTITNKEGFNCFEWHTKMQRQDLTNTLNLHRLLSDLYKQEYKDTLFGQIFMHACLECIKGNPGMLQKIICCKQATTRSKIDMFLTQDTLHTFLVPLVLAQLPDEDRKKMQKELRQLYHFYRKKACSDYCAVS